MPTVSVIMAVHNAERYLDAAVQSVRNQNLRDFEFIIIDDGSTDSSGEKLESHARMDSRIRVFFRQNKGLTASLNEALKLAQGEFIARMDGDDVALPDRLKLQVEYLRAHPQVALLGGAYELIDDAGRMLTTVVPSTDDATLQEQALSGRTPICHPLAMFRREAAIKVGGYDEEFVVAQDLDLWLKLGEVGQLAAVPDVLLRYRQHEQSVSEKKQALQVRNMKLACERAYARRGIQREFMGESGWRPTSGRRSRYEYALRYGWWAFNSGQRKTAIIYGMKAITALPWSSAGWKLVVCAAIKRPERITGYQAVSDARAGSP
jgi:glycosyltransferase involved in cell wall biosynthesis